MDSSTRAWIVTVFGCLGGALMIGICPFCSSLSVLYDELSYNSVASLPFRAAKTRLRFPAQPEAGVTPEARRGRAAVLRRGGVAPAPLSVLAASPFLPWPHASGHF